MRGAHARDGLTPSRGRAPQRGELSPASAQVVDWEANVAMFPLGWDILKRFAEAGR